MGGHVEDFDKSLYIAGGCTIMLVYASISTSLDAAVWSGQHAHREVDGRKEGGDDAADCVHLTDGDVALICNSSRQHQEVKLDSST